MIRRLALVVDDNTPVIENFNTRNMNTGGLLYAVEESEEVVLGLLACAPLLGLSVARHVAVRALPRARERAGTVGGGREAVRAPGRGAGG